MSATDTTPTLPTANRQPRRWRRIAFTIMRNHPELVCMVAAILFSVCSKLCQSGASVQSVKTIHRNAPTPERFFPRAASGASQVDDFALGQLEEVGGQLIREGSLVVMFYAPWCAQSRRTRAEFMLAADYFAGQIKFVAINCWYATGQCRKTNRFLAFPVIYYYNRNIDGFKYSGQLRAESIVHFVEQLMYPLTHITNHESLTVFLAKHERAVVGYFDLNTSPLPPAFYQFFYASMRVIEKYPINRVAFGIVTAERVAQNVLNVTQGEVKLIQYLHHTLVYPPNYNFTSTSITKWITQKALKSSSSIFLPAGIKSTTFSSLVSPGPALVLFVPFYPLSGLLQPYAKFHKLAMSYQGCGNVSESRLTEALQGLTYTQTIETMNRLETLDYCAALLRKDKHANKPTRDSWKNKERGGSDSDDNVNDSILSRGPRNCCISVSPEVSQTTKCDLCLTLESSSSHQYLYYGSETCPLISTSDLNLGRYQQTSDNSNSYLCHSIHPTYYLARTLSLCCPPQPRTLHSQKRFRTDLYHSRSKEQTCHKIKVARSNQWLPGLELGDPAWSSSEEPEEEDMWIEGKNVSVHGLGCNAGNRSLQFVSVDSRTSGMFMHRLGIDNSSNSTIAVIVDIKEEQQFVMQAPVTKRSLVELIHNYTLGRLSSFQRTQHSEPQHAHCAPSSSSSSSSLLTTTPCIVEVTTDTFEAIVMEEEKDVVLLYYTPYCGFCRSIAHLYLSLARYFRHSQSIVFARINGELNDLPWQYNVDAYPSIIFFPAYRKSESVSFPDTTKLRVPNLLRFILTYAAPELKLETAVATCSQACIHANTLATARAIHSMKFEKKRLTNQLSELMKNFNEGDVLLKEQRDYIKEKIRKLEEREQSSRQLHAVLLKSTATMTDSNKEGGSQSGPYLEKHKLLAIQRRQFT